MTRHLSRVLVVDAETDATRQLAAFLREQDLEVVVAPDGESAFNVLAQAPADGLVCEARDRRIDGLAVLARAKERHPGVCAVMITASADVAVAVEAMRRGAYDFQAKPVNLEKLLATLRLGFEHQRLAARVAQMEGELDTRFGLEGLTGNSRAIQRVKDQVRRIATTRAAVMIEGESGVGKGVVARALHQNSARRDAPFVHASCSGSASSVLEQELFGLARAATVRRRGLIEAADGGTLFLDEIGDAPANVQLRLLRLLQDRQFERVGGTQSVRVDVRVIVATSRDLTQAVHEKRFRADLFHQLGLVRIPVPPLRERREDIPPLVARLLRSLKQAHGRRVARITPGALERLVAHDWPGNVRELKNTLAGMVALSQGDRPLEVSALPAVLRGADHPERQVELALGTTLAEAERRLIELTLAHTGGDKRRAAAMLGIGLRTLYRKLPAGGSRGGQAG